MIINLLIKRIRALSQVQTFIRVLPTRWCLKPTGIDTERHYVTVTVRIGELCKFYTADSASV